MGKGTTGRAAGKPARETEIKLRLSSAADGRRRLKRLGARAAGRVFERNLVFDTPDGMLFSRGQLLRLRSARPMGRGGAGGRAEVTNKGPAKGGRRARYKVRTETEFEVSDAAAAEAILAALGLVVRFRYEKRRTTYRLPRRAGLEIVLDETPIGAFLELEGRPREIDRAARMLGFAAADYIVSSYLGLYLEDCRQRGVPPGDMTFRRAR
jgi:adenylate cyclase, class 2